jgi:hypothetical protein
MPMCTAIDANMSFAEDLFCNRPKRFLIVYVHRSLHLYVNVPTVLLRYRVR